VGTIQHRGPQREAVAEMPEVFDAYQRTRQRMIALSNGVRDLKRVVPACPSWSIIELMAHVVSIPAAVGTGDLPGDDLDGWLQGLVESRQNRDLDELMAEWLTLDTTIAAMLDGPGGVLFLDLAIHEHDLRGAMGVPDHEAMEIDILLPTALAAFADPLSNAGLGAIEIRNGDFAWRSHNSEAGWVLEVTPWEGVRAVSSRRTPDELRDLPHLGDPEPYLAILDAHLPLPSVSLHER
jgi:hypothetical protein